MPSKCENGLDKAACGRRCRCGMSDIKAALDSLLCTIVFDSRDWADDRRLAWIYGVLVGWNAASWKELSKKFGFDAPSIARARKYHKALTAAKQLKNKAK